MRKPSLFGVLILLFVMCTAAFAGELDNRFTAGASVKAHEKRSTGVSLYAEMLLALINQYRLENGLNMLRFEPRLIQLARRHSVEMFQQKMVSHHNFKQRMEIARSCLCVENVGWNNNVPQKRFEDWQGTPENNQNMLAEGIQKAGIAEAGNYVTFIACK